MNRKIVALALCAAGLIGGGAASAHDAELSVRGKLEPGACKLSLSSGGVADLGELPARELISAGLIERVASIDVDVDCATPRLIALRAQDNRAASVVGNLDPWHSRALLFGLGISAGRKTGEYHMFFGGGINKPDPIGDGQPLSAIMKSGSAGSPDGWRYDRLGYAISPTGANLHAFMDKSSSVALPQAYRSIAAELTLSIWLDTGSALDLTRQTPIDGSATLELVYL